MLMHINSNIYIKEITCNIKCKYEFMLLYLIFNYLTFDNNNNNFK